MRSMVEGRAAGAVATTARETAVFAAAPPPSYGRSPSPSKLEEEFHAVTFASLASRLARIFSKSSPA